MLRVHGEVDMASAPELRRQLVGLVDAGRPHIVVDLELVEFMDSTGLGVLIGGVRRTRASGGDLRIVCTNDRLVSLFEITGLAAAYRLYADVASALDAPPSSADL